RNSGPLEEPIKIELEEAYNSLYEKPFIDILQNDLMPKCIRGSWAAYEYSQFAEIPKLKNTFTFGKDLKKSPKRTTLSRLSINSDINESVLLFSEISILPDDVILILETNAKISGTYYIKGKALDYFCKNNISPYSNSTTIYDRLLRLNFKVKLNFKIFAALTEQFFYDSENVDQKFDVETSFKKSTYLPNLIFGLYKYLPLFIDQIKEGRLPKTPLIVFDPSYKTKKNDENFLEVPLLELYIHLVADSIFCLNEIIEVVNAYGKSYILNHSFLASAHEKMMLWAMCYDTLINVSEESFDNIGLFKNDPMTLEEKENLLNLFDQMKKQINELLRRWMDEDSMQSLTEIYHGEMAIRRYNSALETHSEGKAYKNFIENMSFLNDDFNDKFAHFFVGFERFKINRGGIYKKIDKLKKLYKSSALYEVEEYTYTQIDV
ncbi:MAG: hypothetical protein WC836_22245, partial [Desulfobacula sp.]